MPQRVRAFFTGSVCAYILTLVLSLSLQATHVHAADLYEPDDDFATAITVPTDGTPQVHSLDPAFDIDFIKFSATQGTYYAIEIANLSPSGIGVMDSFLEVIFPDQDTLLTFNDDDLRQSGVNSRAVFRAPSTATYYADTSEFDGLAAGSYSIRVTALGTPSASVVAPAGNNNTTEGGAFTVTSVISCSGGPCGNVTITLDPRATDERWKDTHAAEGRTVSAAPPSALFIDPDLKTALAAQPSAQVIITLTTMSGATQSRGGAKAQAQFLQDLESMQAGAFIEGKRFELVNAVSGTLTAEGLAALAQRSDIASITLDRTVHATLDSSVGSIGARQVWATLANGTNITGAGVTVCIIDSGINRTHPDFGNCSASSDINDGLCPKVIAGHNFCADELCTTENDNPVDQNQHGTHVAGIIASNDSTYRGVAPDAKLVIIKALNTSGSGPISAIMAGVDWCVANKDAYDISIISMSLGGDAFNGYCDRFPEAATVGAARAAGLLVTIASGNGFTVDPYLGVGTPACASGATSVGATNDARTISSYANRDFTLDVYAPGDFVTAAGYHGGHITLSGTSMATPHVAGAAALLIQRSRLLFGRDPTPASLEHMLQAYGNATADTGFSNLTTPRISVFSSLAAKGDVPTTPGARPFWTSSTNPARCWLNASTNCTVTWTVHTTEPNGTYEFFVIAQNEYATKESPRFNMSILPPTPLSNTSVNISVNETAPFINDTVELFILTGANDTTNRSNVTATLTYNAALLSMESASPNASSANNTSSPANSTWRFNLTGNQSWNATIELRALAEGNNTLNVTVRSSTGSVLASSIINVRNYVRDLTPPVMSDFDTDDVGRTDAELVLATDEIAACRFGLNDTNYSSLPEAFSSLDGLTHTASLSGLTASTSYTYFTRCADNFANLDESSVNLTFTTDAPSSGGGGGHGGGGGGGGGGSAAVAGSASSASEKSWQATTITGGERRELRITSAGIAFESVAFVPEETVKNARITVRTESTPAHVRKADEGDTYAYLSVNHPDTLVASSAAIEFTVPRAWLATHGVDDDAVTLYRYSEDAWHALPTTYLNDTGNVSRFRSDSPGLSLYAIGSEGTGKAADPVETTTAEPTEAQATSMQEGSDSQTAGQENSGGPDAGTASAGSAGGDVLTGETLPLPKEDDVDTNGLVRVGILLLIVVVIGIFGYINQRRRKPHKAR